MEGLKRVKKMKQLKKGDKVLVVAEPEVVEVDEWGYGAKGLRIDGNLLYATDDYDLNAGETGVKVYKLPKK